MVDKAYITPRIQQLKATIKAAESTVPAAYEDDTEYILSTKANRKVLLEGIAELDRGEGKAIKIEDLWK